MKIGILGAGRLGGNLGRVWAARGHEVVFGVRDPGGEKVRAVLASIGEGARAGSVREAAAFGDVVVLAVPAASVPEVLSQANGLGGAILIDATNRIAPSPGQPASVAEEVAGLAPGARVVKAFNTLGAESLLNVRFGSQNASTFICGDDPEAKAIVARLGEEIGFDVVDAGALANSALLESLARLWVQLGRRMGQDVAFKLLRR